MGLSQKQEEFSIDPQIAAETWRSILGGRFWKDTVVTGL